MDVQFWGPSGWQLFHLISFDKGSHQSKKRLFYAMKDVLPCKYCRQSSNEFIKETPIHSNIPRWLYDFHSRVNKKLDDQHSEDPQVEKPVPSPPFSEVKTKYKTLLKHPPTQIPGRDFLLSVAYNYDPSVHRDANEAFWKELVHLFPFEQYRRHTFQPNLTSRTEYLHDMYEMFSKMEKMPSYQSVVQHLAYYKSGCAKKTYKGKTCRASAGSFTKNRSKTRKVSQSRLL